MKQYITKERVEELALILENGDFRTLEWASSEANHALACAAISDWINSQIGELPHTSNGFFIGEDWTDAYTADQLREAIAAAKISRAALAAQQEPMNVEKMREIFEGSPENKKRILFKRGGTVFAESVPEANYVDGSVQHAWVEFQRVYKLGFESAQPTAPVVPQDGWKLISEENPPEGIPVWLADVEADDIWCGTFEFEDDGWHFTSTYGRQFYYKGWKTDDAEWDDDYKPTHWMLLPALPLSAAPKQE